MIGTHHFVDPVDPQLTLLLEICQDMLCFTIIDHYKDYMKYNLQTLTKAFVGEATESGAIPPPAPVPPKPEEGAMASAVPPEPKKVEEKAEPAKAPEAEKLSEPAPKAEEIKKTEEIKKAEQPEEDEEELKLI